MDEPDVEVLADLGGTEVSRGSGHMIAPSLVLTAAHVVCGKDGRPLHAPRVRMLHDGRDRACRLVWQGSGGTDVAVLQIVHDADRGRIPPARWGVFVGSSSGNRVEAGGFPWAQDSGQGWRDSEQVRIKVNLGTGRVGGMLSGDLDGPVPERRPDGPRWAGMSGSAAVVPHPDGDLIVGVVIEEAPRLGAQRLTIVPVDAVVNDARFRELVAQASGSEPLAEPAEIAELLDSPLRRRPASPASLLRADSEVVGFRGRQAELKELHTWCAGSGFSARLLTGPGGQGKSRLARQLAAQLSAAGWVVGVVGESSGDLAADRQMLARLRGCGQRLLLVADYAETRPEQIAELIRHSRRPRACIRLLLIARSDDDWWSTLCTTSHEIGQALADAQVVGLPDLGDGQGERATAFRDAVHDFAAGLERLPGEWEHRAPAQIQPPDLSGQRHGSPLAVQIAALAALLGAVDSAQVKASGEPRSAEEIILEHEARYWTGTAQVQALALTGPARRWAVAAAALCGAADEEEAVALVGGLLRALDLPVQDRPAIAAWLRSLYPTVRRFWGPLQPDRLGEHLVATVMARRPRLVPALLREASTDQSIHALTVLSRAAQHRPDVAKGIDTLLGEISELAPAAVTVATRSPAPAVLLDPVLRVMEHDQPIELLGDILDAVPQETTALLWFAVRSTERYVHICELNLFDAPGEWMPRLVEGLVGLGKRQTDAGRRDLGAQTTLRAVTLCRGLPVVEEAVRHPLVLGLNNLGAAYMESGDEDEALTVLQKAEELSVIYADTSNDGDLALRSMVVFNLGSRLSNHGRHHEALAHLRQAHHCLETLVRHYPHRKRHTLDRARLARTTVELAHCLVATGEGTSAMAMADDAVAVLRRLAADDPDAHSQNLASALTRLAGVCAALGQADRAVKLLRETRSLLHELSLSDEPHHLLRLSSFWQILHDTSATVGDRETALYAADEAVRALRRHAPAAGHTEAAALAGALARLHSSLIAVGRHQEALAAVEEAYTLSDGPAADEPDGLETLLDAGFARVDLLNLLHRPAEGQDLARELVGRLNNRAAQDPARWSKHLTGAERRWARCLVLTGQVDEAVTAARRSAARLAALAETDPRYRPEHLAALHRLLDVMSYRPLGDPRELPLLQHAVAACRGLRLVGVEDTETDGPQPFAEGLNRLAVAQARAGRLAEALDLTREAVAVMRHEDAADKTEHAVHLGKLLQNLSNRLAQAGLLAEAQEVIDEAVALRSELAAADPDEYTALLVNSLTSRAGLRANAGRLQDALADAVKASELYTDCSAVVADEVAQGLSRLLEQLAQAHLEAGQAGEAVTAAASATNLHRQAATDPQAYTGTLNLLYIAAVCLVHTRASEAAEKLDANYAARGELGLPEVGAAFVMVSLLLEQHGHHRYADLLCAEAVAAERFVTAQSGTTGTLGLARALNEHARLLSRTGQPQRALAAATESVAVYQALLLEVPCEERDRVRLELAVALYNAGLRNSEAGQRPAAVEAATAAVEAYQLLALDDPETYDAELADALISLAGRLRDVGNAAQSMTVLRHATAIWVRLFSPHPPE